MTRNNADFQGFIRVHRGVPDTSVEQILSSPRGLGKHWSTDPSVSERFISRKAQKGAVISGYVHPDDVMTPEEVSDFNTRVPNSTIYGDDHWEKEVSVRPGATVHVTEGKDMTFFDEPQVKKQKTFKTPRQSRA